MSIRRREKECGGQARSAKGTCSQTGRQRLLGLGKPAKAIHPDSSYLNSCLHTEWCPHQNTHARAHTRARMHTTVHVDICLTGCSIDPTLLGIVCEPHIRWLLQVPDNQPGSFQISPRNGHLTSATSTMTWVFWQVTTSFILTREIHGPGGGDQSPTPSLSTLQMGVRTKSSFSFVYISSPLAFLKSQEASGRPGGP